MLKSICKFEFYGSYERAGFNDIDSGGKGGNTT